MNDTDRLQFLQGQIQALTAFCFAMIETHPDVASLHKHAAQFLEAALAKISAEPVPEAFVDGLQDMKVRLLDYATSAAARPTGD